MYRTDKDLYSDSNPLAADFKGPVSTEGGAFIVKGAGGTFTDEEAERMGLTGLEKVTEQQLRQESEDRNRATYGATGGTLTAANLGGPTPATGAPANAPAPGPGDTPEPNVARADNTIPGAEGAKADTPAKPAKK